jgi:hypothetical protein
MQFKGALQGGSHPALYSDTPLNEPIEELAS